MLYLDTPQQAVQDLQQFFFSCLSHHTHFYEGNTLDAADICKLSVTESLDGTEQTDIEWAASCMAGSPPDDTRRVTERTDTAWIAQ